jgi:Uma2 family endonuclease
MRDQVEAVMSLAERSVVLSAQEYLEAEEHSDVKHEFEHGRIWAMARATDAHVTIALNLAAILKGHVRGGPCRVYISDMKVRVEAADAFYYPDVMVSCDPRDRAGEYYKQHPCLIVEVLSESTEAFDRGNKFAVYRQLESLEEYVLVDSRTMGVDIFRRGPEQRWVLYPFRGGDEVVFSSVDLRCPIAEPYENVEFLPKEGGAEGA